MYYLTLFTSAVDDCTTENIEYHLIRLLRMQLHPRDRLFDSSERPTLVTTPDENLPILIHAADGPIARGKELQERLQRFTVPIFRFINDKPEPADCGSGVLLKVGKRAFVLTAGHCVRGDYDWIALGVRSHTHRFTFQPAGSNYVYSERGDFGYYLISPDSVETIAAGSRIFLSEKSVEVLSVSEHYASRDFVALGGYPMQRMNYRDGGTGTSLLVYSTTPAGGEHAPASNFIPAINDIRHEIHAWIPQQENVHTLADSPTPATIGELRGASGGGWWSTHLNRAPWQPSNVKLIGTHVATGRDVAETDDGLRHRFSRVSLVGKHLALIARDFPDLHDHIHSTWPAVKEYESDV